MALRSSAGKDMTFSPPNAGRFMFFSSQLDALLMMRSVVS